MSINCVTCSCQTLHSYLFTGEVNDLREIQLGLIDLKARNNSSVLFLRLQHPQLRHLKKIRFFLNYFAIIPARSLISDSRS